MSKAILEKVITDGIMAIKAEHDDGDRVTHGWYDAEVANGYQGDKPFFYNGYIYMTELANVICKALYGHTYENYTLPSKEYLGTPRMGGANYSANTTKEEDATINKVIGNMIAKGMVKPGKSMAMVKVLI